MYMNKLTLAKQVQVITSLVEGNSVNSTVRMTGIAKTTILRLIQQFGETCWKFHDEKVRSLQSKRIQCDEIWAFCHAKSRNVPAEKQGIFGYGDVWTWTAIDADSKLMVSWLCERRDGKAANFFMRDVASRLACRVQMTTDGHHTYLNAVANSFQEDDSIDYAQITKVYGNVYDGSNGGRYSPPEVTGIKKKRLLGKPDMAHVSTSYIERSNLTLRMGLRRYTRLTNGHSKNIENHIAMTAIFWTCYNWCRIHQTTKLTPAMSAGLTTKLWEIEDLIGLMQ
jgi:transposase-like protein